jgi:hypothetical protein
MGLVGTGRSTKWLGTLESRAKGKPIQNGARGQGTTTLIGFGPKRILGSDFLVTMWASGSLIFDLHLLNSCHPMFSSAGTYSKSHPGPPKIAWLHR